jgi:outer membrane cobalamin receptor
MTCSVAAWPQSSPSQTDNPPAANPIAAAAVQTTITVTEKVTTETPASMIVLGQKQLEEVPGVNLDDRLRQVPGFSLFRRSSSLVANPTTQGVSLRAIGSTGASRTLILWDDVPLNDPFGGWVYWTRVNPLFIDRVELVRGANTSVFGDKAMGGTIALFSKAPQHQYLDLSYFGGNENTHDLSGGYSNLWGPFGASVEMRGFTTDGYFITPTSVRGRVDDRANVRFATGIIHLDYLGVSNRLALRLDTLAEERHNGTLLQQNSTSLGTLSANYIHTWQHDQFAFAGYHTREQFHSTFSAVSATRNFERLTSRQTVPAEDVGGAAYWQHRASVWNTVFGADVDDAHGISNDLSYPSLVLKRSGGTLLQHGIFGQGDVKLGPARFYAGLRHQFTGQGDTFISPNGGMAVGLRQFRFRASGYRSFRAPTLNELYRDFRVGNALTKANAALRPETLVGVETGFDWMGERNRLSLTLFHDELSNLIANETLSISKTLILRQRRNFASGVSRGVETDFNHRWRNWSADLGYLYADARLATGPRLAQVPKQQGTGSLTYSTDATLVSFGVRSFGLQFDDDLNEFKLPGYAALQLAGQQRLKRGLYAQAAIENLLDRQYLVALTPTPNTGSPRLWRIGLRWDGAIR